MACPHGMVFCPKNYLCAYCQGKAQPPRPIKVQEMKGCHHRKVVVDADCGCEWYRDCEWCIAPYKCACGKRFNSKQVRKRRLRVVLRPPPPPPTKKPTWEDFKRKFLSLFRAR